MRNREGDGCHRPSAIATLGLLAQAFEHLTLERHGSASREIEWPRVAPRPTVIPDPWPIGRCACAVLRLLLRSNGARVFAKRYLRSLETRDELYRGATRIQAKENRSPTRYPI